MTEILDSISGGARTAAISEAIGSQLAGRTDGPADALRHILIAAELSRKYSETYVDALLKGHELYQFGAPSRMDSFNNDIGKKIGNYVKQNGGGWQDVVKLAQEAIERSLSGYSAQNIDNFLVPRVGGYFVTPDAFLIGSGSVKLLIPGIALMKTTDWKENPKVDGIPVSNDQANWPDQAGQWKLNFVPEIYQYQEHVNYTPITPSNPSTINNSLFNFSTQLSQTSNNANADAGSFANGTILNGGDYQLTMPSMVLNQDGLINNVLSGTACL